MLLKFLHFRKIFLPGLIIFERLAPSLGILVYDFKNRKMAQRSRWLVKAIRVSLRAFWSFIKFFDNYFLLTLSALVGLLMEVCTAVARRLERKLRFYGWVWPFKFLRLMKLWVILLGKFVWHFWRVWYETVSEAMSLILQLLVFFRLFWAFDSALKWVLNNGELSKLWHKLSAFFIPYGNLSGWCKFFLSASIFVNWFWLMNKGFFLLCWVEPKRVARKKRIKYISPWKRHMRKNLRLCYAKALAPLKHFFSLINWERQPMAFFWAFYSAFCKNLRDDKSQIKQYYLNLFWGVIGKLAGMVGQTERASFYLKLDEMYFSSLGFIPGVLWLLFHLTIMANGIYLKYLTFKFLFFFFKYLWRWAFFLIDFPLAYFFKGTMIYTLHSFTIKALYRFVDFFIFRGIPYVLKLYDWFNYIEGFKRWLGSLPLKIRHLRSSLDERLELFRFRVRFLFSWVALRFFYFASAFNNVFNDKLKKKTLEFIILLRKRYFRVRYIYIIRCRMLSRKGLLIWKKLFKPRLRFLVKNSCAHSLNFWPRIANNAMKYKLAKVILTINRGIALKRAFLKYKLAVFLDLKVRCYKVFIMYCKFLRLVSFICLSFVRFFINVQCFYFALRGKLNEFYTHKGCEKELYGANLIISKLEDKIEQSRAIKTASKKIVGK